MAVAELLESFKADFESAVVILTEEYGQPTRSGCDSEDDAIPLSGLCEFAVWDSPGGSFFLAIAYEDRGAPMLLMVGVTE
ncbi:MAG: hypothetical protein NXI04_03375 [Planctomycetaceae bacterium]|nr:hypothetical protein [Planctomycetaceae bacterium]